MQLARNAGRFRGMWNSAWRILRMASLGYVADSCLSRGAAIAYYTVFSLAPILLMVIAIAGLVFGEAAARGAVVGQMSGLMGQQGADAVQMMIQGAANRNSGLIATVVGGVTLLLAASGVFAEMQSALNAIWKTQPPAGAFRQLLRTRLVSLGLVLILGFLLLVSLIVAAALAATGTWFSGLFPGGAIVLRLVSLVVSFILISVVFAAIYRVLPDTSVDWRDVTIGAAVTTLLFTLGKNLISLYVGSSSIATTYGAAGALAIVLVWIYYSSQIFLFGAEFTRAYAEERGSLAAMRLSGEPRDEIGRLRSALERDSAGRGVARR